jgi:hypothetical protein
MPFPEKEFKQFLHGEQVYSFSAGQPFREQLADGKAVRLPAAI